MTMSGGGTGTGGGSSAPKANVLPAVPGHTVKEVTFPRRNLDAGLASYSIKSETYDPLSTQY